jgi:hypothetical protein
MAMGEDGIRVGGGKRRFALDWLRLAVQAGLESNLYVFALDTASAFRASTAAATSLIVCLRLDGGGVLVLLAAAVTFCVVRLVLASGPAVFALLDRTALFGDREEISVCGCG